LLHKVAVSGGKFGYKDSRTCSYPRGNIVVILASSILIVRQRNAALRITLAGMLVFRGVQWLVIGRRTLPVKLWAADNRLRSLTTYYLPAYAGWRLLVVVAAALGIISLCERKRCAQHGLPISDKDTVFATWFVSVQWLTLLVVLMNQFKGMFLPVLVLGVVATAVHVFSCHPPIARHKNVLIVEPTSEPS
jgi:D-xylose transport system permease protein